MWAECGAMALEIAELTPYINSPHPAPELSSDNPHIHAKAWNKSGLVIIAVVNDQNEPAEFKMKMVNLDFTVEADVMFENRKIHVAEGAIEDMIDGYGTRIYRFDVRNKPDQVKDQINGNLTIDPGFEDLSSVGVPAACYANPATTRVIPISSIPADLQGEHSLRLNNPSVKPGTRLSFYNPELDENKSYTISIMARTGISSNLPGGKKGGTVRFRLGLGSSEKIFDCTETWEKFEINGIRIPAMIKKVSGFRLSLKWQAKAPPGLTCYRFIRIWK